VVSLLTVVELSAFIVVSLTLVVISGVSVVKARVSIAALACRGFRASKASRLSVVLVSGLGVV